MTDPGGDLVILLDDDGRHCGVAPRATVHSTATPVHLAFSCYVLDGVGRVLVTRRALTKRTWPGVWTNSFCGHPRPGETLPKAIARHGRHELGLEIRAVTCVLPDFRYRAVDPSGIVENEVCPVYLTHVRAMPVPNPDEVVEHRWVRTEDLGRAVAAAPWAFSPWAVAQVRLLADLDVGLGESAMVAGG